MPGALPHHDALRAVHVERAHVGGLRHRQGIARIGRRGEDGDGGIVAEREEGLRHIVVALHPREFQHRLVVELGKFQFDLAVNSEIHPLGLGRGTDIMRRVVAPAEQLAEGREILGGNSLNGNVDGRAHGDSP